MLRWILRLVAAAVALVVLAVAFKAVSTLEVGARPASSLRPIEIAPDVKFVEANGIRFAYLEEGAGPLALLFHGYPETPRSWAVVQRRLAAAGYRVVAPYMRGYPPTSAASDGDYSVGALGKDVSALIDALGAPTAVVVGHDWGASAVYAAAAADPSRIAKLVALAIPHPRGFVGDPTILIDAPHFLYYQLPTAERLLWSYDFAHIDRIYRQWAPSYTPPPEVLSDIKAVLRTPGATAGTLGYYWALFETDPEAARAAAERPITMPALMIAGGDGDAIGARYEKARPAFTSDYAYVELAGVGHFPQLEAPDETADAIVEFIGPASGHGAEPEGAAARDPSAPAPSAGGDRDAAATE